MMHSNDCIVMMFHNFLPLFELIFLTKILLGIGHNQFLLHGRWYQLQLLCLQNDAIGELKLPVCQLDLAASIDKWRDLQSIRGDGVVSDSVRCSRTDDKLVYCNQMGWIVIRYRPITVWQAPLG